jgi:hypothetical protein
MALMSSFLVSRSSTTESTATGQTQVGGDTDSSVVRNFACFGSDVACDVGQVDKSWIGDSPLAAGEGEQAQMSRSCS